MLTNNFLCCEKIFIFVNFFSQYKNLCEKIFTFVKKFSQKIIFYYYNNNLMYKCIPCEYETNERTAFYHHNKSKKHDLCSKKINIDEYEKIKKENDELKQKLQEKEMQQKLLEKENEKLEEVNKILKENSGKTINNTQNNTINIGSINYVNENFKDAPPLEKITNFIINGIDTNDISQHDKFIDDVIYHHKNKILYQLLGDHIVALYKKTDLNKQSFHTTDTSRLNYVVRVIENSVELVNESEQDDSDSDDDRYNFINEDTLDSDTKELISLKKQYEKQMKKVEKNKKTQIVKINELENNKKVWTIDKNGYKICKLLIDPTIKQLVTILKRKIKEKSKKKVKNENINFEMKYSEAINNILETIDTKKLKNEVNKYIAPKFNLDKKTYK